MWTNRPLAALGFIISMKITMKWLLAEAYATKQICPEGALVIHNWVAWQTNKKWKLDEYGIEEANNHQKSTLSYCYIKELHIHGEHKKNEFTG